MAWPCFMLEPTTRCLGHLRRFVFSDKDKCPKQFCHNASVQIFEGQQAEFGVHVDDRGYLSLPPPRPAPEDPRWPTTCEGCGRPFQPEDEWQVWWAPLYRTPDGREVILKPGPSDRCAPPGAMWYAKWLTSWARFNKLNDPRGPLHVMLPGGLDWNIDGEAKNGGYWTREGEPPNITVTPSILVPGYHGFLTNGSLTDPV